MADAIVWRYQVRADRIKDFEAGYGPDGTWVQFFRRDEGYLGTELIRCGTPSTYITVDSWETRAHYDAFAKQHRAEYDRIDESFEQFTTEETMIGKGEFTG